MVEEEEEKEEFDFEDGGPGSGDRYGGSPPLDDPERIRAFVKNLEVLMDGIFAEPPAGLRGTWFDEQSRAWKEISPLGRRLSDTIESEIRAHEDSLTGHGLTDRALLAKLGEFRDKVRGFMQLRNARRAAKVLRTGAVIMESVVDAIPGVGGAYKEAVKGLHHLTELALEEGP